MCPDRRLAARCDGPDSRSLRGLLRVRLRSLEQTSRHPGGQIQCVHLRGPGRPASDHPERFAGRDGGPRRQPHLAGVEASLPVLCQHVPDSQDRRRSTASRPGRPGRLAHHLPRHRVGPAGQSGDDRGQDQEEVQHRRPGGPLGGAGRPALRCECCPGGSASAGTPEQRLLPQARVSQEPEGISQLHDRGSQWRNSPLFVSL